MAITPMTYWRTEWLTTFADRPSHCTVVQTEPSPWKVNCQVKPSVRPMLPSTFISSACFEYLSAAVFDIVTQVSGSDGSALVMSAAVSSPSSSAVSAVPPQATAVPRRARAARRRKRFFIVVLRVGWVAAADEHVPCQTKKAGQGRTRFLSFRYDSAIAIALVAGA